jgi:hypothetical protein
MDSGKRTTKEQNAAVCDSIIFPVALTAPQLLAALSHGIISLSPEHPSQGEVSTHDEAWQFKPVMAERDRLSFTSSRDQVVYQSILSRLSTLDTFRSYVFAFLWKQGLTVLAGSTYGADFVCYSGTCDWVDVVPLCKRAVTFLRVTEKHWKFSLHLVCDCRLIETIL